MEKEEEHTMSRYRKEVKITKIEKTPTYQRPEALPIHCHQEKGNQARKELKNTIKIPTKQNI